jgi:hypothetical protein
MTGEDKIAALLEKFRQVLELEAEVNELRRLIVRLDARISEEIAAVHRRRDAPDVPEPAPHSAAQSRLVALGKPFPRRPPRS